MCSKVKCSKCQKYTWSGCGEHIEEALEGVPQAQRCLGHEDEPRNPGLIARIFGRK